MTAGSQPLRQNTFGDRSQRSSTAPGRQNPKYSSRLMTAAIDGRFFGFLIH
jgi:hypothetical protein